MRSRIALCLGLLAGCSSSDAQLAPGDAAAPTPDTATTGSSDAAIDAAMDAGSDAGSAGLAPDEALLRVHYPALSHTLAVRGSGGGLDWKRGLVLVAGTDDTFALTLHNLRGPIECKPLLDDQTWSLGPNFHVAPGAAVDLYPRFNVSAGKVSVLLDGLTSKHLPGTTRTVWAYLPPTYLENARARMPVVYLHDGQNLFDPKLAFGGNTWMADAAMDGIAAAGTCPSGAACQSDGDCGAATCTAQREAILVGIANTADRIAEYTPVPDPTDGGGNGDAYLAMIVEDLKPRVDAMLRTLPGRADTAMLGSSLGGLISLHAGISRGAVFGRIGALSPSTWWAGKEIIAEVTAAAKAPRSLALYLDSGDAGASNDDVTNTNLLAATCLGIGYVEGADLHHLVAPGDQHNEVYWARRLPGALRFVLGAR